MAQAGAASFPGQPRFQVLLGMVAASEDLPEKAIELNLRALELEPGNVGAWHNMGLTYLVAGRPQEAIRCFEKALSLEDRADTRHFLVKACETVTD